MPHTFLSLDMALIPADTKAYVPGFWSGRFSNDQERMIIDGKNNDGDIVHPQNILNSWLQWEPDPQATMNLILSTAIEYTVEEFLLEKNDSNSIWFEEGAI